MKNFLSPMGVPLKAHWSCLLTPALLVSMYGLKAGALLSLLFFLSVIFHEYAHVWVAQSFQVPVAEVKLMMLGAYTRIKWDMSNYSISRMGWVAIAGPAASLLLAFTSWLLWPLTEATWVSYLLVINVLLAMLNSLPFYPSDGGRVLYALLSTRFSFWTVREICIAVSVIVGISLTFLALGYGANIIALLMVFLATGSVIHYVRAKSPVL